MGNSILFVIDVQAGFINSHTEHIPEAVQSLQRDFDRVIVTRFINAPDSGHRKWIHWDRFGAGSDDVELAFQPRAEAEMLDKSTYSCLTPGLRDRFRREGVAEIHLAGIATDNCVLKTAVDLFEAGIRPVVHTAACASHGGDQAHQCGLLLMGRMIGREQLI